MVSVLIRVLRAWRATARSVTEADGSPSERPASDRPASDSYRSDRPPSGGR